MGLISCGSLQRYEESGEKRTKDKKKSAGLQKRKITGGEQRLRREQGKRKGTSHPGGQRTIHEIHRKLITHTWSLEGKCEINRLKKKKGRMREKEERKTLN